MSIQRQGKLRYAPISRWQMLGRRSIPRKRKARMKALLFRGSGIRFLSRCNTSMANLLTQIWWTIGFHALPIYQNISIRHWLKTKMAQDHTVRRGWGNRGLWRSRRLWGTLFGGAQACGPARFP